MNLESGLAGSLDLIGFRLGLVSTVDCVLTVSPLLIDILGII